MCGRSVDGQPRSILYCPTPLVGEDESDGEIANLDVEIGKQHLVVPRDVVVGGAVEGIALVKGPVERVSGARGEVAGRRSIWNRARDRRPGGSENIGIDDRPEDLERIYEEWRSVGEWQIPALNRVFPNSQRDEDDIRRRILIGGALRRPSVEALKEGVEAIERASMGVGPARSRSDFVSDQQETGHGFFEVAGLQTEQIALLPFDPARPGAGQTVGLKFAHDRRLVDIVETESGLNGMPPLMGQHESHGEVAELLEEGGHEVLGVPLHGVVDRAVESVGLELLALERAATERNVTLRYEVGPKLAHRLICHPEHRGEFGTPPLLQVRDRELGDGLDIGDRSEFRLGRRSRTSTDRRPRRIAESPGEADLDDILDHRARIYVGVDQFEELAQREPLLELVDGAPTQAHVGLRRAAGHVLLHDGFGICLEITGRSSSRGLRPAAGRSKDRCRVVITTRGGDEAQRQTDQHQTSGHRHPLHGPGLGAESNTTSVSYGSS